MDRRTAISRIAIMMGGTLLNLEHILATATRVSDSFDDEIGASGIGIFTRKQVKMLDEIADVILPRTQTPGAKDAKTVGSFMARYISDCLEPPHQQRALEGMAALDAECKKRFGKSFMRCARQQQHQYFVELDAAHRTTYYSDDTDTTTHWFRIFWELALFGFFTSKVGCEKVLRWVEVPGRYETIDYKKGDRAWAED